MIGETVERQQPFRQAWLAGVMLGALLAVANFAFEHNHFARLSVAFFGIGIALLVCRRRPFKVHFEEDGIEVAAPFADFISFDRIDAVRVRNRKNDESFSFEIILVDGVLHVPAGLDVPSIDVYEFLKRQLPEGERISLPRSLQSFFREQKEQFGSNRVWAFRSIPSGASTRNWDAGIISLALLLIGIVWAVTADHKTQIVWLTIGWCLFLAGMLSFLIAVIVEAVESSRVYSKGKGGLIVSPIGIALQKGDVRGRMRWDEITNIVFRKLSGTLVISFAGGSIELRDVYNRPLNKIYRLLLEYW